MLLSILICRLTNRRVQYFKLRKKLDPQLNENIEVLTLEDSGELTIGTKRNSLLRSAKGKYVAFIDDDDLISEDYISQIMDGIEQDVDCCSLVGEITTNKKDPKMFVHSIQYDSYFEKNGVYYRPPNHLNVIKKSVALRFTFPESNFGEDTDWAMQICKSGLLKIEHIVKKTIYFYDYRTDK
jgi:glycosyltransferase involved in cell wall biosynthesis